MAGLPNGAPVAAIVDNRVEILMEMGFDVVDAEAALKGD